MNQRKTTTDEYRKQVNIIVEYIINHLDEDINIGKLAEMSNFSPWHFHRIMRAFLGEPIGLFIVRLRAETAARLLRYSELSISDIAYKVGYDVPASLSKSFKQLYNVSPSEYRKNKSLHIMKPEKINERLNLRGPKIQNFSDKMCIYIKLFGEYGKLDFTGTWGRLWQFIKENKLFSAGIEHIAIYHNDPKVTQTDKLQTDLCLVLTKEVKPQGEVGVKTIQGGKYAMFLYQGPYNRLDEVYDTIYGKWLPESGLILRNCPGFEKYANHPDRTPPEKLKTEIYIPVE